MKMNLVNTLRALSLLGLLCAPARGQSETNSPEPFRRPGVVADRTTRTVRIEARATGVTPDTETEFFLIGPNSGHDYEAIAVARAKAMDIRDAVEFIGIPAGRPVHPEAIQFWPRGERVLAWVERKSGERMRLEDTLWNRQRNATTPRDGFVFTGSVTVDESDPETGKTRSVFAADAYDPQSIISAFNLRTTVFDIPRIGSKEDLYPIQVAHKGAQFETGEDLIIVLEPERKDGPPRVLALTLQPIPGDSTAPDYLVMEEGGPSHAAASAETVASQLDAWSAQNRDLFVTLDLPGKITVRQAREAARFLADRVNSGSVRPEPPPANGLYYRAFLPNPDMLVKAPNRRRPWEVHIPADGKPMRLILSQNLIKDDGVARLEEKTFEAETPAEAAAILNREESRVPALLIFIADDTTVESLLAKISPLREKFPHLFIFPE